MKIPFDSLCLAAVVDELEKWQGARIQKILQMDAYTIALQLYKGQEGWLLLSCHPEYARVHLITRRPHTSQIPPTFCQELRKRILDARLTQIHQRNFDRILDLTIDSHEGTHYLVSELMGKHSNIMLVDPNNLVVAAAKWVGRSKSRRTILPRQPYMPPPFPLKKPLTQASLDDSLGELEGCSPFLRKLLEAEGLPTSLLNLQEVIKSHDYHPVYSPGNGAYPVSVSALGFSEVPRRSISQAVEQYFEELIQHDQLENTRHYLLTQLDRVLLAREIAFEGLQQALDTASRASQLQERANLILAYAHDIPEGTSQYNAWDKEGNSVILKLNSKLTPLANANQLFAKAKRAKESEESVKDQYERIQKEVDDLKRSIDKVKNARDLEMILEQKEEADKRHWLHHAPLPARTKEERPYQGLPIRELLAPGNWKVLYGESAPANDYLTTRVAKSNDIWLHVRGSTSAHVVIQTHNQPERIQAEVLRFAAKVAIQNSPSKHAGYVPVDYTLSKYVRKPKGSAPGTVIYSREKTLHIENT